MKPRTWMLVAVTVILAVAAFMAIRSDTDRSSELATSIDIEQNISMPPVTPEMSMEVNDSQRDAGLGNETGEERDAPETPNREMAPSETSEWWAESFPNERDQFAAQGSDIEWGGISGSRYLQPNVAVGRFPGDYSSC